MQKMMGNSRIERSEGMESVLLGKEASSETGEMLKFRRNESVALWGFFSPL